MMRWERPPAGFTLRSDEPEVPVQIRNFDYALLTIEVRAGALVTWMNENAVPHTATDRAKRWDTGILARGASKSQTFATAGSFPYYCTRASLDDGDRQRAPVTATEQ